MFQTLTRSLLATVIASAATLLIVAGSASPANAATHQATAKCTATSAKSATVPVQHASRAAFILTLR